MRSDEPYFVVPAPRQSRDASTRIFSPTSIGVDGASKRQLQFATQIARIGAPIDVLVEQSAPDHSMVLADAQRPAFKVRFARSRFFGKTRKTGI
jgi:hypothetical protein